MSIHVISSPMFQEFEDTLHRIHPNSKTDDYASDDNYIYWTQASGQVLAENWLCPKLFNSNDAEGKASGPRKKWLHQGHTVRGSRRSRIQTPAICVLNAASAGGIPLCFVCCWVNPVGAGTVLAELPPYPQHLPVMGRPRRGHQQMSDDRTREGRHTPPDALRTWPYSAPLPAVLVNSRENSQAEWAQDARWLPEDSRGWEARITDRNTDKVRRHLCQARKNASGQAAQLFYSWRSSPNRQCCSAQEHRGPLNLYCPSLGLCPVSHLQAVCLLNLPCLWTGRQ